MTERKEEAGHAKLTQTKKATPGGVNDANLGDRDQPAAFPSSADTVSAAVVPRKLRYLIGFRAPPGTAPRSDDPFLQRLTETGGVEVVRRIQRAQSATPQGGTASPDVLVAVMDESLGQALRASAPAHVIVERDLALSYSDMAVFDPFILQHSMQAMQFSHRRGEFRFRVVGEGERPIPNALVNLCGPGFPAHGLTDSSGGTNLQSYAGEGAGIVGVYVRPAADYWERYIQGPSLDAAEVNVIRLTPLSRGTRSSGQHPYGWGRRMMKFDRVASDWDGAGIKIGLIDSGCDCSHAALRHIVRGVDLTRNRNAESWKSDELGQGTHCAGLIAAAGGPSADLIGCAPACEMHIFKVVPGGYCSDLIEALDQCIERRLDIVQIGVGAEQYCELAAQKIAEARQRGIACIAPAGNSAAPVAFPGNVPTVLTVTAIGKLGEYPLDTRHAHRALPQLLAYSGIYATNFSGWGPQVGLCAPGVAVISSVPGGGYSAWDGTAMAAAHVVGFAALLLAHHPLLQNSQLGARTEQRVALLLELLRTAAVPAANGDPALVGAGMPDLEQVPGLQRPGAPLSGQSTLAVLPGDPNLHRVSWALVQG
ncbi:MAG: S8 family serine peptidase [Steroidobacteraceae bacterium]|jgi:subtilisin family serine protease